jgi:hypothetical protein
MEGGPNIQEAENLIDSSTDEEGRSEGCGYKCCDPRGSLHRFVALIFMCFLGFGESTFEVRKTVRLSADCQKSDGNAPNPHFNPLLCFLVYCRYVCLPSLFG